MADRLTEGHRPETCPTCKRYTTRGLEQLAVEHRGRPIFGTDFSKPLSEIIEGVRKQLMQARGQLSDIGSAYTGWQEHVESVEGLLTCGLIALAYTKDQMAEWERRRALQSGGDE